MVERLELRSRLDSESRAALMSLPYTRRTLEPDSYLVREGDPPHYCSAILDGFAFRQRLTGEGRRLILSIHMPGEFVDLENLYLELSDHSVQALTRLEVACVPRRAIETLSNECPQAGAAMWTQTLIESSIAREWAVNVGRRDARARIAHLLSEFALRLETAGLGEALRWTLPMTHEQIADACGLTPIHVSRILKAFAGDGLIVRDRGAVRILDRRRLAEIGDFTARYLHIPQRDGSDLPGVPAH